MLQLNVSIIPFKDNSCLQWYLDLNKKGNKTLDATDNTETFLKYYLT